MELCITPLPQVASIDQVAGGELKRWPERLTAVPPRISSGSVEGVTAEIFLQDTEIWKSRAGYYKKLIAQLGQKGRYRNLLDTNAQFGGFAAALVDDPVWVINMVPTVAKDTLGVIYERGLIGSYQDWLVHIFESNIIFLSPFARIVSINPISLINPGVRQCLPTRGRMISSMLILC
jgi:Putative S-adenosyl-L-methionine-dependent methyltransferase